MKPANYPERKRRRQVSALTRMLESPKNAEERKVLMAAFKSGDQRAVRTKKDRTARAKFRA